MQENKFIICPAETREATVASSRSFPYTPGQDGPAGAAPTSAEHSTVRPAKRWALSAGWWLEAVAQRWKTVVCCATIGAVSGVVVGFWLAKPEVTVSLMRRDDSGGIGARGDWSGTRGRDNFLALMRSRPVAERVAAKVAEADWNGAMAPLVRIEPGGGGDLIELAVRANHRSVAVAVANAFAEESIAYSDELRQADRAVALAGLERRFEGADREFQKVNSAILDFEREAGLLDPEKEGALLLQQRTDADNRIASIGIELGSIAPQLERLDTESRQNNPELATARAELNRALASFTEQHPKVKELRASVAVLEASANDAGAVSRPLPGKEGAVSGSVYLQLLGLQVRRAQLEKELESARTVRKSLQAQIEAMSEKRLAHAKLRSRFEALKEEREKADSVLRVARADGAEARPPFKVLSSARPEQVVDLRQWATSAGSGLGGGAMGLALGVCLSGLMKLGGGRIRSESDLERGLDLPVVARLGDLNSMSPPEREQWALRTLASLRNQVCQRGDQAFECGIISSNHGEGRSTWIQLLAEAARKQGYPVVVVSEDLAESPGFAGAGAAPGRAGSGAAANWVPELFVTESKENTRSLMRVPPPHLGWDLEKRRQWWQALRRGAENCEGVVLVDLPPASDAQSIFMADNLNNLIWLCGNDMAETVESRRQLGDLKKCRCRVIGAALNRQVVPKWRARFERFTALAAAVILSLVLTNVRAADPTNAVPPTVVTAAEPVSLGAMALSPSNPADWQKRLTLGPGDVIDIALYGQESSVRAGGLIGPDGLISYSYAQNLRAAGLTVDELKEALEKELGTYIRSPKVIIIPRAYNSKKYYLLGSVVENGVFALDRPVTIVEAIAKARGFAVTVQRQNTLIAADLSRSFIVRRDSNGGFKRDEVDFEALFEHGDLTQNKVLAPDDYLYFPSRELQEIYVLGEVRGSGVRPFVPKTTVIEAIIEAGGFTERAYKAKVLVVRGSLTHPETFVVSASDILAARTQDFRLQPRDIVYVNEKPWAFAEDLLKRAVGDFFRAAVVGWAGQHTGPLITSPVF